MLGARMTKIKSLLLAFTTIAVAGACFPAQGNPKSSGSEKPAQITQVTLGISVTPGVAQSMYTSIPQVMNYWKDAGLSVKIQTFAGASAMIAALASGQIDFGASTSTGVILGAERGLPITGFFSYGTKNVYAAAVRPESPITSIQQLAGKTIGVQSLTSDGVGMMKALAYSQGVDPKSLKFVAVGAGAQTIGLIDKVDALGLWDSPYALIQGAGVPVRIITTEAFSNLAFQQVLSARTSYLKAHPDLAVAIAKGIAQASVFAFANPSAAVKAHYQAYPDSRPAGVSDADAVKQGLTVLNARLASLTPTNGVWGMATTAQITDYEEALKNGGVISGIIPPDKFWDPSLLKRINDFDVGKIKEDANTYDAAHK